MSSKEAFDLLEKVAESSGYKMVGLDFFEAVRAEAEDWGDPYKGSFRNEMAVVRGMARRAGLPEVESAKAYAEVLDGFRKLFAKVGE